MKRVERDSYLKKMEKDNEEATTSKNMQQDVDEVEKEYDYQQYTSDLVSKYQKALYKIVAPGHVEEVGCITHCY